MKAYSGGKKDAPVISTKSSSGGMLDLPPIGVPSEVEGKLYNREGRLFWQGVDLSNIAESRSDWSPAAKTGDIHRPAGKIGIGTSDPQANLHVEGSIYGMSLKVRGTSGIIKSEKGNFVGGASLEDLSDVKVNDPLDGNVLMRDGDTWISAPASSLKISHSNLGGMDEDDHKQYLTEGRHSDLKHDLSNLSVAEVLFASSRGIGIGTNKPMAALDVAGNAKFDSIEVEGLSGVLKASSGRISGAATTIDIKEGGNNLYFSEDRVIAVSDPRYLRIDASNVPSGTIDGLDADKLDGKQAGDFATSIHVHRHSEMLFTSEDDHHPRKHQMFGSDHSVPDGSPKGSVPILGAGSFEIRSLSFDDVKGDIPVARVDMGEVSLNDLAQISGAKSNIQSQIDAKASSKHSHSHSDLDDSDVDDHVQYLNQERAREFVSSLTTDDIKQGKKNPYFSEDAVIDVTNKRYVSTDGSNIMSVRWPEEMLPLNAERVGGLTSSSFSRADHSHKHSEMSGISEDDHHAKVHDLLGSDHRISKGSSGFILVSDDGTSSIERITEKDILGSISLSKISGVRAGVEELNDLVGIKGNIQSQMDAKAEVGHVHSHSELRSSESFDDHPQYMNEARLAQWASSRTTDDVIEGNDNLYFEQSRVRAVLSSSAPLHYDVVSGKMSLSMGPELMVSEGSLRLPQDIGRDAAPTFSAVTSKGSVIAKRIGIGIEDPGADLHVNGNAIIGSLSLGVRDGILISKGGKIGTGVGMNDLSGVSISSPQEGDGLYFDGAGWVNRPAGTLSGAIKTAVLDLVSDIPDDFDALAHDARKHDVPSLTVSKTLFVDDEGVGIGCSAPKNSLDVAGSVVVGQSFAGRDVAPDGCLVVEGGIGIGVSNPATALDVGTGKISGGSFSSKRRNVLDLSSSGEMDSVTFKIGSGEISLLHDRKIEETKVMLSETGWISSAAEITQLAGKTIDVSVEGKNVAVFSRDGLSIGTDRNSKFNLDVTNHIGVASPDRRNSNFIVMRASSPDANPTICFPADKSLTFGTFRSYDAASIWKESASIDGDGNLSIAGGLRVRTKSESISSPSVVDGTSIGLLRIRSSSVEASVIGIEGGKDGAIIIIKNSGDRSFLISPEVQGVEDSCRISGEEIEVPVGSAVQMMYDGEISRWFAIH